MRKELGVVEEKADKDEESKEAGEGEEEDEEMKAANEIDSLNKKAGTLQAFIMPIIFIFLTEKAGTPRALRVPKRLFPQRKGWLLTV